MADGVVVVDAEEGRVRLGLAAELRRAPPARQLLPAAPPCTDTRPPGGPHDATHRPTTAAAPSPQRRKPRDRPLLIVITGHGKGKRTSAFGMLMRSWARGYRCGVFQFVKSGKWKVGEAQGRRARSAGSTGRRWATAGRGCRKDLDESADLRPRGLGRGQARGSPRSATSSCCSTRSPTRSSGAGSTIDEVVATLRDRPGFQHVVVTGRDAPPELIEAADLVSEVVKVKHPMDAGIRAQQGIEW